MNQVGDLFKHARTRLREPGEEFPAPSVFFIMDACTVIDSQVHKNIEVTHTYFRIIRNMIPPEGVVIIAN